MMGTSIRVAPAETCKVRLLCAVSLACFTFAPQAIAQVDMESLIHQAMDQLVNFEVVDKPLPEAFLMVAEQTGVGISISPESLKLLPHGASTRMTARMKNIPLRDGIDRLVRPLGMTYRVVEDGLVVEPTAALRRVGRRATWDELETLQWLTSLEWSGSPENAEALLARLQFHVKHDTPGESLVKAMQRSGTGLTSDLLSSACRAAGWAWYPSGRNLVVVDRRRQIDRELSRPITLRVQHQPLADVLAELAGKAHMTFRFEPGAIALLPRETRQNFSVLLVDATVEQALEVICGATGLSFSIGEDGVQFSNSQPAKSADQPVAIIVIPGRGEFPIHEEDLTPELKKSIDDLIINLVKSAKSPPGRVEADPPASPRPRGD